MSDLLSSAEQRAMDLTVELVNLMSAQVVGQGATRPSDIREFVTHIHAIQHAIMAQAAARAYPERFRLLGEVIP